MFRRIVLSCFFLHLLLATVGAQEQERRDPQLAQYEGSWQGVCDNDGRQYPCDVRCHWDLLGAYMVSEFTVWQDAQRSQVLMEEREFARPSGDDTHALYSFSSSGVTRWGTRQAAGMRWTGSARDSDGLGDSFTVEWNGQNGWTMTRLVQDEEGNVLKKLTYTLQRATGKKAGGR